MRWIVGIGSVILWTAGWSAAQAADAIKVPPVDVVGITPVPGIGISRDQMPVNVQGIGPETLDKARGGVATLLDRRLGSVALSDSGGNPFQPGLSFRGFSASHLMGEPQGLAVYQNGVRLNESFGDLISWEMLPTFAVNRVDMLPGANPAFGLNALGGAMVLDMKTGFSFPHAEISAAGGSFGRRRLVMQKGQSVGNVGFYAGIGHAAEDGWREHSPQGATQFHGDVEFRGSRGGGGVSLGFARSDMTGNGPAPVQLLARDRNAVFTYPDESLNRQFSLSGRGNLDLGDTVSLQASAYLRKVSHRTLNGDAAEIGACQTVAPATQLCSEPGEDDETALVDADGRAVPSTAGGSGMMNRTVTETLSGGVSVQLNLDHPVLGHRNTLTIGVSEDEGHTSYRSESEAGTLLGERGVIGGGVTLGTADYLTNLRSQTRSWGLFLTDSLSLTDSLTLTLAGRHNITNVVLRDRVGSALNGNYDFERFNGAAGLAWAIIPELTAFAGYGESSRAPTPAELSCADPARPCRFPNAFLSDPPLRQVVSRSVEAGLRGRAAAADKSWSHSWSVAGFLTQNDDDIIFVASGQSSGTGYFRNAGRTRRVGIEASGSGKVGDLGWFASYGLVRATFENDLTLNSPTNPAAVNRNVTVRRGTPMAGIPMHTLKLGASYDLTRDWEVAVDSALYSSRRLRGDDPGHGRRLAGYAVVNAETEFRPVDNAALFLRVENILDRGYETFGLYGNPGEVLANTDDNQMRTPGQPRSFWAGARVRF